MAWRQAVSIVDLGKAAWQRLGGDGSALIEVPDDNVAWPASDHVVTIAHNAGDNLTATERSLRHGAAVIEIDVVSFRERLYAGHRRPISWIGPWLFRRPTLEQIWAVSAPAAVMLDLKESSPAFLERLFTFLSVHARDRLVILVSGNPATLEAFQRRMPEVIRLYGASPTGRLEAFMQDDELIALVDGLNLRHDRIDSAVGAWTTKRGLWLIAWPVNEFQRARDLIKCGVDIITTDNLAMMTAINGDVHDLIKRRRGARHNTNPVDVSTGPVREGRE
ncbi:MAG: glycerophosphodiester phosphodiesterase [Thermomicrobiales bacterium]